jgi:hypothetical protein
MPIETSMQCSACGKVYPLTSEYLAQYAGQTAQCECGGGIVVPSPVVSQPARPNEIVAGWQDGGYVVAQKAMKLPRRCFKCNAVVKTQMTAIVLEWVPGAKNELRSTVLDWVRGSVLPVDVFGFVNNAIASTETESIVIRFGRCPAHRARLNKWWLAGAFALLCLLCLLPLVAGWVTDNVSTILLAGGLMFSMLGMVLALKMGPPFRIVHFQNNRAWITGFCKAYVQSLPLLSEAP